jgi:hypothetical protein
MAKKKTGKKANLRTLKPSENKYLPMLLIILVSILILMGLLMWRNRMRAEKYEMVQKQISQSSEPTQSYQVDTVNDGVYTNSQYGFTFKYPKDTFKYQVPATNHVNEDGWFKQEWFPTMKSDDLYLYTEIGKSYDNKYRYPEAKKLILDQSVGDRDVDYIHRLKPLNNTIPNGVFYYWEIDMSTELKRIIYIYSVSWEKEGTVITVSLGSPNKKLLESKYNIFRDVANSIQIN